MLPRGTVSHIDLTSLSLLYGLIAEISLNRSSVAADNLAEGTVPFLSLPQNADSRLSISGAIVLYSSMIVSSATRY